ncbi:hypothetical protein MBLNU457_1840t1 [Dothideomycetes sp. NU457]
MSEAAEQPTPMPPGRLVSHFNSRGRTTNEVTSAWSELWETKEDHFWDRGYPSPALIDYLESDNPVTRTMKTNDSRLKVLVPGCGKGYDPAMLALHGIDAYGLEISPIGAETAASYTASQMKTPLPYNFGSEEYSNSRPEAGHAEIINGDFFASNWLTERGIEAFDVVLLFVPDLTSKFLCAMPRELRPDWARRMSELVKPGGFLICLEFPLYKDRSLPGPPWGLNGVYEELLSEQRGGKFVREEYVKPKRSYEVSKGTDMLSIWRRQ